MVERETVREIELSDRDDGIPLLTDIEVKEKLGGGKNVWRNLTIRKFRRSLPRTLESNSCCLEDA